MKYRIYFSGFVDGEGDDLPDYDSAVALVEAAPILPLSDKHGESYDLGIDGISAKCRTCGCTDDEACIGGCTWVESDLCSACVKVAV